MSGSLRVIAGEVSGDLHAGAVVNALREKDADLHAFGIGGDRLAQSGMEILVHIRETVSYTHLRAHETEADLVSRLLLE